jgi:hypothetical protein
MEFSSDILCVGFVHPRRESGGNKMGGTDRGAAQLRARPQDTISAGSFAGDGDAANSHSLVGECRGDDDVGG